ncbi:MAG: hypothetical protein F6K65_34445, partial [Moorea sp. SIO3C2]|nr:hypothetical protein [Moorena sp. SIO3C2]
VPFACQPEKRKPEANVTAVDLGINTTATIAVVTYSGTVIHREVRLVSYKPYLTKVGGISCLVHPNHDNLITMEV